jgi:tetratricopeptide (TPR) repeat protein
MAFQSFRAARRTLQVGVIVTFVALGSPSYAADTPAAESAKAAVHFEKAKELYEAGAYSDARRELKEARQLDPQAKDLVFNLGVVCEKLQEYDEAIESFRAYEAMPDVTSQEREKAEAIIRRIDGAKRAMPKKEVAPRVIFKTVTVEDNKNRNGRMDGLTIGALGITGGAFLAGTVFGVLALTGKPGAGSATSAAKPYVDLQDRSKRAHAFAIGADVSFVVMGVAAVTAAILYFTRSAEPPKDGAPKEGAPNDAPKNDKPKASLNLRPSLSGDGALFVF